MIQVAPNTRSFSLDKSKSQGGLDSRKDAFIPRDANGQPIAAHTFTFRELAAATKNFRQDCLLGEGGFGRVYKGHLENGQVCVLKYVFHGWGFFEFSMVSYCALLVICVLKHHIMVTAFLLTPYVICGALGETCFLKVLIDELTKYAGCCSEAT